jgi:hypothetical protein
MIFIKINSHLQIFEKNQFVRLDFSDKNKFCIEAYIYIFIIYVCIWQYSHEMA